MGQELKRDTGSGKLGANFFVGSFPIIIALLIVAYFSGSLFYHSIKNLTIVIIIEACFVILLYGFICFALKKRFSEMYISVCENGVRGFSAAGKRFSFYYNGISKMTVDGNALVLYSNSETVTLNLKDAAGTAALIQSKIENL